MAADAWPELGALREAFFAAWSRADWQGLESALDADSLLTSSQHGLGRGHVAWRGMLQGDAAASEWMRTSNHATLVGSDGRAVASAYAIGLLASGTQRFLFGASVVLKFAFRGAPRHWSLIDVRIGVNWCKGEHALVSHWRKPPDDAGWQVNDEPPTIVSELDSPWAFVGEALPQADPHEALRELYSKYAWAIDQGDIALLSDCYTDDAAGGFSPLGRLQGRHAIVGQQKSFRRHWPWMQHFADVLRIEPEADGRHARMIVARIIPERPVDETGRALYGAHYQLRARNDDGRWRICWFDYRPGWFTADDAPAFDIGVTHA
jgi:hypothetical protein